jgi:hypothetical protein
MGNASLPWPFIILTLGVFTSGVNGATVQDSDCNINGDPDVYGPGIRISFYLQWASMVIFQIVNPNEVEIARTSIAITALAVYINAFRNFHNGSLIAIEYPILWYFTQLLLFWNWPVSEKGAKKTALSVTIICWIFSMYYAVAPWVFWKAWQYGHHNSSCHVYSFIFTPINAYSHGLWTFYKVGSVFSGFISLLFFIVGCVFIVLWISAVGDDDVEQYYQKINPASVILGIIGLISGGISIAFTEKTISVNHITFPGVSITDSGQLIALLIGTFSLFRAVFGIPTAIAAST